MLRPYCALNYAWDEPALPHKLVLELPGSRFLGIFQLDKVGCCFLPCCFHSHCCGLLACRLPCVSFLCLTGPKGQRKEGI